MEGEPRAGWVGRVLHREVRQRLSGTRVEDCYASASSGPAAHDSREPTDRWSSFRDSWETQRHGVKERAGRRVGAQLRAFRPLSTVG